MSAVHVEEMRALRREMRVGDEGVSRVLLELNQQCADNRESIRRKEARDWETGLLTGQFDRFDGTSSVLFSVWAEEIKNRVAERPTTEDVKRRHLLRCLSGAALKRFDQATKLLTATFAGGIRYLEERYEDPCREQKLASEFNVRMQLPGESIVAFVMDLQSLCPVEATNSAYDTVMVGKLTQSVTDTEYRQLLASASYECWSFAKIMKKIRKKMGTQEMLSQSSQFSDPVPAQVPREADELIVRLEETVNELWSRLDEVAVKQKRHRRGGRKREERKRGVQGRRRDHNAISQRNGEYSYEFAREQTERSPWYWKTLAGPVGPQQGQIYETGEQSGARFRAGQ
jgi:hypothetical protein